MKISIRYRRAEEVFGSLLTAYHAKRFPYQKLILPQEERNLPKPEVLPRGGREQALFFWAVCYYMRLTESVGAVRKMGKLFTAFPGYFFPESFDAAVAEHGPLLDQLVKFGLAFQSAQVAQGWEINLKKLAMYWNGDPRTLYDGVRTYTGLCKRIITGKRKPRKKLPLGGPFGFFGFRHKMVSMLTYFYVDKGIVAPIMHPVPVDFHVMRVLLANEIVVPSDPTARQSPDQVSAAGRKVTLWYCRMHGVDPIDLCNVLWYLSRTWCKRQLGNRSNRGPSMGRQTVVTPFPLTWSDARITSQLRVCGRCPIAAHCKWNVPDASYSRQGLLILRGERPRPPQMVLF